VASWVVGPLGSSTCDQRCGSDRVAAKCAVPERTVVNPVRYQVGAQAALNSAYHNWHSVQHEFCAAKHLVVCVSAVEQHAAAVRQLRCIVIDGP
jgi:hypothetical protein